MPAWEAVSFVGPVLESLAAQTYENLEVLISVDLSNDKTAELCEQFAAGRPNFRVIRQAVRLGWIDNCRTLIRLAEGEYLFFAFHDDPLKPAYVGRLVEALERNPGAVVAFSDMISDRGIETYCELEGLADRVVRARRVLLPQDNWWVPVRGLVRTQVAKSVDGPRRHRAGEFGGDWPWMMSLALRGEFIRVPEPLVVKNRSPRGLNAKLIRSASSWKRLSVALACLGEIRRAGLPFRAVVRLHVEGLLRFFRSEWWTLRS
jgi:glycosyltransferase involved in cell wall biosynthesis